MNDSKQHNNDAHTSRRSQSGAVTVVVPPFVLDSADLREGEMIRDSHVFD